MKKVLSLVLCLMMAGTIFTPSKHIHDEKCGYNPETQKGCKFEASLIDPCFGKDPEDDV